MHLFLRNTRWRKKHVFVFSFFCKTKKFLHLGEVQKLRQDVEILLNSKTAVFKFNKTSTEKFCRMYLFFVEIDYFYKKIHCFCRSVFLIHWKFFFYFPPPPNWKNTKKNGLFFSKTLFFTTKKFFMQKKFLVVKNRVFEKK